MSCALRWTLPRCTRHRFSRLGLSKRAQRGAQETSKKHPDRLGGAAHAENASAVPWGLRDAVNLRGDLSPAVQDSPAPQQIAEFLHRCRVGTVAFLQLVVAQSSPYCAPSTHPSASRLRLRGQKSSLCFQQPDLSPCRIQFIMRGVRADTTDVQWAVFATSIMKSGRSLYGRAAYVNNKMVQVPNCNQRFIRPRCYVASR